MGSSIDQALLSLAKRNNFRNKSKVYRLLCSPYKQLRHKFHDITGIEVARTAKVFFGDSLQIWLPDRVSSELFRYGFFGAELSGTIMKLLKPGSCFVDIGAHVGYFSLLASRLVGYEGRVVSFEPTPRTRKVLELNLKHRKNVVVEPYAVWSSEKKLDLKDFGWKYSAFNTVLSPRLPEHPISANIQVQAMTLDSYIAANDLVPSLIKIDAESAELEILKGASDVIDRIKPVITLEVGDIGDSSVVTSHSIVKFMLGREYEVFQYIHGEFVRHELRDHYGYDDLIFFPKEVGRKLPGLLSSVE